MSMRVSAVICELNPLHYGHTYLLEKARQKADCVIAIMSGNFVQRAESAILDKYARAELAVRAGVDLVLELPFPWCAASAEYFAKAGTSIAGMLSADTLAFGVGTEDVSLLTRAASFFADPEVEEEIRNQNKTGDAAVGAAVFRERCLKSALGEAAFGVLRLPNDILAIEYLRQIHACGDRMQPQMIRRVGVAENPQFLGATQIRTLFSDGSFAQIADHVPNYVYKKLLSASETGEYTVAERVPELAFLALRTAPNKSAHVPAEGDGGLFHRICRAAEEASSPQEMLSAAATKKYTNARIRRVLLYHLLGISREMLCEIPTVTTVLAANETGCAYLSAQRRDSVLSFITKPAEYRRLDDTARGQYERVLAADRLYTLCMKKRVPSDYFLLQSPYIVK